MLYTLLQHGVETTVDRRHKTHRIINWIKQVDKIKKKHVDDLFFYIHPNIICKLPQGRTEERGEGDSM